MNEIPYWLSLLAALAAINIGYRYGQRLHRHGFDLSAKISVNECPLIPAALLLFVLLQVCASTLLRDPRLGWALPVTIEYHLTPAFWLLKVAFVAFAMSAIATVSLLQRHVLRWGIVVFTLVVVVAVEGLNRWAALPHLGEIASGMRDGVIIQTNESTCAAAASANIARQFGIEATEADMVELLHTTWAGTSPAQIVYGFRRLGLEATKVYHADADLAKVTAPAILLIDAGGEPDAHAVAYMGRVGTLFDVWDPAHGRLALPLEAVHQRWRGRAIEVRQKAPTQASAPTP
jgi:predicted double-glycine peptidase